MLNNDIASATEVLQNGTKQESTQSIAQTIAKVDSPATQDANLGDLLTQGDPSKGEGNPEPETTGQIEPKPQDKQKEELISRRFATLSQKERELQKKEVQLKREREEFLKQREQGDPKAKTYESPLELLEAHGWSYQDATEFVLTGQKPETKKARELEAKLQKMEDERKAEREAAEKTKQADEEQKKINDFKAGVKSQVQADPVRFELIHQGDNFDLVYDTMVAMFEQNGDGKVPDVLMVADLVEKHLENELKTKLEKLKSAKKLSSLFHTEAKAEDPNKKPESRAEAESVGIKTLTNSQSQTATKSANRVLTDEEALEEAAKLMSSR